MCRRGDEQGRHRALKTGGETREREQRERMEKGDKDKEGGQKKEEGDGWD